MTNHHFYRFTATLVFLGVAACATTPSARAAPIGAAPPMSMPMSGSSNKASIPPTSIPPTSIPPTTVSKESDFASAMMKSMEAMDKAMMGAPMTGNADRDFAAMMIPHHQGAIDMAQVELRYGKNPVLRRLSQEIIATQLEEIAVMKRAMASLADKSNADKSNADKSNADKSNADKSNADKSDIPTPSPHTMAPHMMAPHMMVPRTMAPHTMAAFQIVPRPIAPAVSGRDRVYTADQVSNTVSVINPSTNQLLGVIRLGDPVPQALGPLYKGALLVHGLGYSPDHRTLAAISIGSNSVSLIDTATNAVKGTVYVGRSPHEGFWTPDGRELWVAVRGEDYISVIDPVAMKETKRITTTNGPAMVLFSPDGRYGFVPSSFVPELCIVDVAAHRVVARVKQASPFSPNLAVSADGSQVWFTLKDTGKTQVMNARPPFQILSTLDTGPFSNHVALVDNARGHFAYITVGGQNAVKVYTRERNPRLVTTIPLGDVPHGIWTAGDSSRVYVGLENGDAVQAIDTLQNRVVAKIGVGQLPQALVYVPDAVPTGDGLSNLVPPGEAARAAQIEMRSPASAPAAANARASVVVNSLGLIDHLQIVASGLEAGREYTLSLVASPGAPFGERVVLGKMKANPAGAATLQTLGPLRRAVTSLEGVPTETTKRYLLLTTADGDSPVLVQSP